MTVASSEKPTEEYVKLILSSKLKNTPSAICKGLDSNLPTHHHPRGDGNAAAAVSVRHDVAVTDAEECDGYEPHGVQQVGVLLVVVPTVANLKSAVHRGRMAVKLLR